jgi:hypothetical protein
MTDLGNMINALLPEDDEWHQILLMVKRYGESIIIDDIKIDCLADGT